MVRWVTTSEYPLLYVFDLFSFYKTSSGVERIDADVALIQSLSVVLHCVLFVKSLSLCPHTGRAQACS